MNRSHALPPKPKKERRVTEKNRREYERNLYDKLYCLLPTEISKGFCPLPDKIDEAIDHIKSMEKKLENHKEMKKKLMESGKRPQSSTSNSSESSKSSKLTNVEVQNMGSNANLILISGMEDQGSFYGIIRRIQEEGFDVVNANFSNNGNSVLQVVRPKVHDSNSVLKSEAEKCVEGGISTSSVETSAVAKRLKELIEGYSLGKIDSRLESLNLLDFELEPELLTSDFLGPLPPGEFSFLQQK